MKLDLSTIELIVFGDFGVLTTTPFRNNGVLAVLPGRVEYLAELIEQRKQAGGAPLRYAIMGNKGGVAFGLQTEDQAREELRWTAEQIQATTWVACFAHPSPKEGYGQYADPKELKNRKPEPGMLNYLIEHLEVERTKVLVVGNYGDDGRAAFAAGVVYRSVKMFFGEAEEKALALVANGELVRFDPEMEG